MFLPSWPILHDGQPGQHGSPDGPQTRARGQTHGHPALRRPGRDGVPEGRGALPGGHDVPEAAGGAAAEVSAGRDQPAVQAEVGPPCQAFLSTPVTRQSIMLSSILLQS